MTSLPLSTPLFVVIALVAIVNTTVVTVVFRHFFFVTRIIAIIVFANYAVIFSASLLHITSTDPNTHTSLGFTSTTCGLAK